MSSRSPDPRNNNSSPAGSPKNMSDTPKSNNILPGRFSKSPIPSDASENSQMEVYHPGQQVESPSPITSSPYPIPMSQMRAQQEKTQYIDRDIEQEQAEYEEFRAWRRAQQQAKEQRQQQNQQQYQQVQVRPQPQPPTVLPNFSQSMTPGYYPNSGYGVGNFDLGRMHGLPNQQQMQAYPQRQGHRYGPVIASGNARIVRGNATVVDDNDPEGLRAGAQFARQHDYQRGFAQDKARFIDGDLTLTKEDMKAFWNQD